MKLRLYTTMRTFWQYIEAKTPAACPRCEMVEKRADQNIYEAERRAESAVLNFRAQANRQLRHLFSDIEGEMPKPEPILCEILWQRMTDAKRILTELELLM